MNEEKLYRGHSDETNDQHVKLDFELKDALDTTNGMFEHSYSHTTGVGVVYPAVQELRDIITRWLVANRRYTWEGMDENDKPQEHP